MKHRNTSTRLPLLPIARPLGRAWFIETFQHVSLCLIAAYLYPYRYHLFIIARPPGRAWNIGTSQHCNSSFIGRIPHSCLSVRGSTPESETRFFRQKFPWTWLGNPSSGGVHPILLCIRGMFHLWVSAEQEPRA